MTGDKQPRRRARASVPASAITSRMAEQPWISLLASLGALLNCQPTVEAIKAAAATHPQRARVSAGMSALLDGISSASSRGAALLAQPTTGATNSSPATPLTVAQVCVAVGVGRTKLLEHLAAHPEHCRRVGNRYRFDPEHVAAMKLALDPRRDDRAELMAARPAETSSRNISERSGRRGPRNWLKPKAK